MPVLDVILVFITAGILAAVIRSPIWRTKRDCVHSLQLIFIMFLFASSGAICIMFLLHNVDLKDSVHAMIMGTLNTFSFCSYMCVHTINKRRIVNRRKKKDSGIGSFTRGNESHS